MPLSANEYQPFVEKSITFQEYLQGMIAEAALGHTDGYAQYIPQNLQRTQRILKTVRLSDAIITAAKELPNAIYWLVLSEHWCGDAAQILPVMQKVAEASAGKIDLKIIYRDENPVLMQAHLTNGTKSIPKLIQLDPAFNYLADWGPRPTEAQDLVMRLKANPATAPHYAEVLHKWYATDKTNAIQLELLHLIQSVGR